MNEKRNANIDLIRSVSCIAIIGLHSFNHIDNILLKIFYQACGFGVPFFFMASGFFLLKRKEYSSKYVMSKCWYLIRIVVIWNLIHLAKLLIMDLIKGRNLTERVSSEFLYNLAGGFIEKGFFWHFWYIGALIIIYLLLPIIARLERNKKVSNVILILLLLIDFSVQFLSYNLGYPIQEKIPQIFRLWSWLTYFYLGGYCARNIDVVKDKVSIKIHIVISIILFLTQICWHLFCSNRIIFNNYAEYYYDDILTIVANICLFLLLARINLSTNMKKISVWFAKYTLGIYVVHPIFMSYIRREINITNGYRALMMFAICLGLSILACIIIYRIKLLRKTISVS